MKIKKSIIRRIPFTSILLLLNIIICSYYSMSQTNEIKGITSVASTSKPLPFVNIKLISISGKQYAEVNSDQNGSYIFRSVDTGMYSCIAFLKGYEKLKIKNVHVTLVKNTTLNLPMKPAIEKKIRIAAEKETAILMDVETPDRRTENTKNNQSLTMEIAPACSRGIAGNYYTHEEYNREGYDYISENEFNPALQTPLSTFSIDVDRASYANVRRFITQGALPPASAVRIEEMINYFSYDYPQPKADHPFSITTEVITCPWNRDHQLALVGLQGKKITLDRLPPANLVFLIDVSGSMNSPDKLPLLKRSLGLLVNELRESDHVAITVYAGNAGLVLPPTAANNKEKIMEAINNLEAGGSTAGGAGINLAYKVAAEHYLTGGNNRVILATDGDFNVGVSSDGELVKLIEEKRKAGIYLTVLGFGTGNYQDGKMEKLADKGNGNYAYIDNIMEAQKTLVNEMGGTLLTIAKDVKLQVEFNPAQVKEYKLIGYENRLLHDRDFNDDNKDAGELGSGHTVTALYEIIPANGQSTGVSVDPLKYQLKNLNDTRNLANELFTVKFRYKLPAEEKSLLITHVVAANETFSKKGSDNIRFAAAVSGFGMLLRNSKFKGSTDYKLVLSLAEEAKGKDIRGYRGEFIRMVEMAQNLNKQSKTD